MKYSSFELIEDGKSLILTSKHRHKSSIFLLINLDKMLKKITKVKLSKSVNAIYYTVDRHSFLSQLDVFL